ncbi:MAG: hypothetical protein UX87_C0009G0010 [Candidatus Amesbacteria bacterium GW2011_GWA1_47_16]|uniref:Uncharacterized protein n=4 Tax=Candidatus Amesiibacteriota TaxID=1752730 RepID=A0A0G1UXS4_9BACT|nr:MAG: hypothetical protein UX86_C0047G0009 [Candidatus Amesbacteria bacterium GW2011_GWC1_47_15]KKU64328.1 MAG: hypothetical protein UX87_C0009G0010 [Candidatus Amesbacteria bacterium GW2011_GWA1_47_16]KKU98401.1 MAG: hypothetical protein UY28_C0002G0006 [Candidatus Amesbacteria bacterium GW2011_GWB1_48_13]OGC98764.1 MAG: hypothetical protein A2701_01775 [Candidatus Amesbacteria bacterium RIFCSPHIGHO2_01_FULL_47_34]OGD00496.1 MAG: hypothetical protein A2972_03305 [Candidatus Amesbacteria bact
MVTKIAWWKILLIAGIGLGVLVTLQDYRRWRWEETHKYGYGYESEGEAALPLSKLYLNRTLRVRLKYPEEWQITENEKFKPDNQGVFPQLERIIPAGVRVIAARWDEKLILTAENTEEGLPDIADTEVERLAGEGKILSREREYMSVPGLTLIVLTWEEEKGGQKTIRQRVLGKNEERLIILDTEVAKDEWDKYKNTIRGIYESLVAI